MSKFYSYTRLWEAVETADLKEIEEALFIFDERIHTAPLVNGYSAPVLASKNGSLELLKLLLLHPSFSCSLPHGKMKIIGDCFLFACEAGHFDIVHFILTEFRDYFSPTPPDEEMCECLWRAAAGGHCDIINLTMSVFPKLQKREICAKIVESMKKNVQNCFSSLDKNVVRFEGGELSEIVTEDHSLHLYTLLKESTEISKLIELYPGWYKIRDRFDRTVFEVAAAGGDVKLFDSLLEQELGDDFDEQLEGELLSKSFKAACKYARCDMVKYFIENGMTERTDLEAGLRELVKKSDDSMTLEVLMNSLHGELNASFIEKLCQAYFESPRKLRPFKFLCGILKRINHLEPSERESVISCVVTDIFKSSSPEAFKYVTDNFPVEFSHVFLSEIEEGLSRQSMYSDRFYPAENSVSKGSWLLFEMLLDKHPVIGPRVLCNLLDAERSTELTVEARLMVLTHTNHIINEHKALLVKYFPLYDDYDHCRLMDMVDKLPLASLISSIRSSLNCFDLVTIIRACSASAEKPLDLKSFLVSGARMPGEYRDIICRYAAEAGVLIVDSDLDKSTGTRELFPADDRERNAVEDMKSLSRRNLTYVTLKSMCRSSIRCHLRALPPSFGSLTDRIVSLYYLGRLPRHLVDYLLFRQERLDTRLRCHIDYTGEASGRRDQLLVDGKARGKLSGVKESGSPRPHRSARSTGRAIRHHCARLLQALNINKSEA